MLVAPHFLIGTAIAVYMPEAGPAPASAGLAALAAITSHFVLDAIPHRDTIGGFHLNRANIIMEIFDAIITFGIFFALIPQQLWGYGLLIGGVAIFPDILAVPGLFWSKWCQLPIIKPFHRWHTKNLQDRNESLNWFWGLLPQVLVIVIAIYFITKPPA